MKWPPGRSASWREDLLALLVIGLGFALRVRPIREFWNSADEGIYYHAAHAPPETLQTLIAVNTHPPLYYYLLRFISADGAEFFWLRVPALLFGTLAIAAIYRVGRRLNGARCGLIAALLLALSPGAIALSQVARPYALELLLLIGALGSLLRYFDQRGRRNLFAYTACMLGAGLVHYSAFLVLGGFCLVLAVAAAARWFKRRELRDLSVAQLPPVAAGAALYWLHVRALLESPVHTDALGSRLGVYFTSQPAALWQNFHGVFDYLAGNAFATVGVVAFLVSLVACLRERRFALDGICLAALAVAIGASAASLYPFGGIRHSAYLAPFLALPIAVAGGVAFSRGPRVAVSALLVLAVVGVARLPAVLAPADTAKNIAAGDLQIPSAEVASIRESLDRLRETPGIVFMDLSTLYTLLPLMGDEALRARWVGPRWLRTSPVRRFRWGSRDVVVVPYWLLRAGEPGLRAPNHLQWSLRDINRSEPELAQLLRSDTRIISADGRRIQRSIRAMAQSTEERRSIVMDVSRTPHLSAFKLDVARYQRSLDERTRGG